MKLMDSRPMGFILCLILVVNVSKGADATTYEVGGSDGWRVPSNTTFYAEWASKYTFHIGDSLNFTWATTHDVAVVTKTQYDACNETVAANRVSPVIHNLTTAGEQYFICTISGHCQLGQKLVINVSDSSAPPSPPPPPPPSSSSASTVSVNVLFAATYTLFVYLMAYV